MNKLIERLIAEGRDQETNELKQFFISDISDVWYVKQGEVDLFFSKIKEKELQGPLYPVRRVEKNQLIFPLSPKGKNNQWTCLGHLGPDAKVIKISSEKFSHILSLDKDQELQPLIENWFVQLTDEVILEGWPENYETLSNDKIQTFPSEMHICSTNKLSWIKVCKGEVYFMDNKLLSITPKNNFIPITNSSYLTATQEVTLEYKNTADVFSSMNPQSLIENFNELCCDYFLFNIRHSEINEQEVMEEQRRIDKEYLSTSLSNLKSIFAKLLPYQPTTQLDNNLFNACAMVAQSIHVKLKMPSSLNESGSQTDKLDLILRSSKVRSRKVGLKEGWWNHEHGSMLGFVGEEQTPVALIPASAESYEMFNLETNSRQIINSDIASELNPFAYVFYRPLEDKKYTALELIKFGVKGNERDFIFVFFLGMLGGLLGIATPLITGQLFDTAIPNADKGLLFQLILASLASTFGIVCFELTREFSLLRIEGKMDTAIQMSIWDRLIKLPVNFFSQYSSGDLMNRVMGVNQIRKVMSDTLINSVLASMFSLFNFFLLFYYSFILALVALGIVIVMLIITSSGSLLKIKYERMIAEQSGILTGMLNQFIAGVAKIRISGAETKIFSQWAGAFLQLRKINIKAYKIQNFINSVNSVLPLISSIFIFATVAYLLSGNSLSTGAFLAFNAAFGSFMGALLSLTGALITSIQILPIYERTKPILQAIPESSFDKEDPGVLAGNIELNHVSFSYDKEGPPTIKEISLQINAGDFIAVVGPSGSGKSTLMRLLLGFENPDQGAIYYDGKNLDDLDLDLLRRQIGVVLQNGKLLPGDILTNIIGSASLTVEDAWQAAKMAGFDKDINEMPMGMHTLVSEGGVGLSGGQRQRLLIARSIVHKPKILFFDEATSALDNATQEIVSKSIESLKTTRIVIAHRLSTIINANKIYVIKDGVLEESGNYESLYAQGGIFTGLAKQQIA